MVSGLWPGELEENLGIIISSGSLEFKSEAWSSGRYWYHQPVWVCFYSAFMMCGTSRSVQNGQRKVTLLIGSQEIRKFWKAAKLKYVTKERSQGLNYSQALMDNWDEKYSRLEKAWLRSWSNCYSIYRYPLKWKWKRVPWSRLPEGRRPRDYEPQYDTYLEERNPQQHGAAVEKEE